MHFSAYLRRLPLINDIWRLSRHPVSNDPTEGWKIHVTATVLSAADVLSRAVPILRKYNALYKVAARPEVLVSLNSGIPDFSQIGKFLTVYPRSADEAVDLARALHRATAGLVGPRIPFDARYRPNSLVHYRYGALRSSSRGSGVIHGPEGERRLDQRRHGHAVPHWLRDPFNKAREGRVLRVGPIGVDLLAYKVKTQRGKGGVYEALDLTASPPRVVILKEGRRHGETDWSGGDGFSRVKYEARVLRALGEGGVRVPRVLREFTQDGNHYLVLERIAGRCLLSATRDQPRQFSWRRAEKILQQIGKILSVMHAAGWVWRDCKPSHIFVHQDTVTLIDFEGACRVTDHEALPWGSPHYVLPEYARGSPRQRGTREDDYALGVIAFQFLTGTFPSENRRQRSAFYRRSSCPEALRVRIEALLQV